MVRSALVFAALLVLPSMASAQTVTVTRAPNGDTVTTTTQSPNGVNTITVTRPPDGVGGGVVIGGGIDQSTGMPLRDTRPATGTSVIRGRIIDAPNGTPLRKAQVRIMAPEIREMRTASTDTEGRYEFKDLPAGRFNISASKTG